MKEILWLGRGGQGAFTAAKLFGAAYTAHDDSHYALAFPSFGPERRGAPVRAFTKLDEKPVLDRSQTEQADFVVVLDDTLYASALHDLLKPDGRIIVNSKTPIPDRTIRFCWTITIPLPLTAKQSRRNSGCRRSIPLCSASSRHCRITLPRNRRSAPLRAICRRKIRRAISAQ